jgi:hypothetical protein
LLDQTLNPTNLNRPEAAAALEANAAEPKLGDVVIALDVNMRRFLGVARVEVKAIRAGPQDRRHRFTLPDLGIAISIGHRRSRTPR